jgi:hypothetical protein
VRITSLIGTKQQDSEWKARLLAIQNTTSSVQGRSTSTVGGFSLIRNGTRKRNAMIPEVHTFRAPEVGFNTFQSNAANSLLGINYSRRY